MDGDGHFPHDFFSQTASSGGAAFPIDDDGWEETAPGLRGQTASGGPAQTVSCQCKKKKWQAAQHEGLGAGEKKQRRGKETVGEEREDRGEKSEVINALLMQFSLCFQTGG
jgi:hypothetical protein